MKIGEPIKIGKRAKKNFIFIFLFLGIFLTNHSLGSDEHLNTPFSFWTEFPNYRKIQKLIIKWKTKKRTLFLAVHKKDLTQEILYQTIRLAQQMHVPLRLWLLLRKSQGYWANKWNVRAFKSLVEEFLKQLQKRKLHIQWIIIDMEPPLFWMKQLEMFLKKRQWVSFFFSLRKAARSIALSKAVVQYRRLVESLHQKKIRVHVVTSPFVLEDQILGMRKLQNALGIPIEGVAWDEISFMVYRPVFSKWIRSLGNDFVFQYAKKANHFWGKRAGIDLGPIGSIGVGKHTASYQFPKVFQKDVQAVWRAGVHKIHVFSLEGMKQTGGWQRWFGNASEQDATFPFWDRYRWEWMRKIIQISTILLPDPK